MEINWGIDDTLVATPLYCKYYAMARRATKSPFSAARAHDLARDADYAAEAG